MRIIQNWIFKSGFKYLKNIIYDETCVSFFNSDEEFFIFSDSAGKLDKCGFFFKSTQNFCTIFPIFRKKCCFLFKMATIFGNFAKMKGWKIKVSISDDNIAIK